MPRVDTRYPRVRARHEQDTLAALGRIFEEMSDEVKVRDQTGSSVLLPKRWDRRLADVVFEQNRSTARDIGLRVAGAFGDQRAPNFDPDVMDPWLRANAALVAERINRSTRDDLDAAEDSEDIASVLTILTTSGAAFYAGGMVASSAGFAAKDAAEANGAGAKRWKTNSGDPRSSHASMNGEVVPLGQPFSNGLMWPGDSTGGGGEVANCQCSLTIL